MTDHTTHPALFALWEAMKGGCPNHHNELGEPTPKCSLRRVQDWLGTTGTPYCFRHCPHVQRALEEE